MRRADKRLCCFCGRSVDDEDYIQIDIGIPREALRQYFGAHREHLAQLLHVGFQIELPDPVNYEEDRG